MKEASRVEAVIRTPDRRLRVFVSSIVEDGELAAERRAALLAGAAESLRRRVGLRAWPSHRRAEAALVDQIRQALEADRFDQAFAAGAQLSQREAVAAAQSGHGAGPV